MKKLFTLLLLLCSVTAFSQQSQDTLRLKHFSTWAIAPSLSVPFQYMDIEPISMSTKPIGFGLNLEKHLSHYTSFQVGYSATPIYSTSNGLKYEIGLRQWDARFYFHITNGNTLRNWRSTQLYVYGGIGKLKHNSKIFSDSTDIELESNNGSAVVAIVGGGAKYRVGNRTSLFLDGRANFTSSDKLDATKVNYTFNDGYFNLSLGISYTFGKKRMIEWDNPYTYLVPEVVHDTTVVLKTIKYEAPPKPKVVLPDSCTIYYTSKSWTVEMPYADHLDSVIEKAIQTDDIKHIKISAYCDTTGSDKTNKALVEKRALNVLNYINAVIVKRTGIDVSMTTIVELYDESAALYAPDARNRKVVVSITKPIDNE
jgi:outer membrane protein OmpA-like peptidoglycan-associated protein